MGLYAPVPTWSAREKLLASKFNQYSTNQSILTKRPANIRIASEFAENDEEPYLNGISKAVDDLPDNEGIVYADGRHFEQSEQIEISDSVAIIGQEFYATMIKRKAGADIHLLHYKGTADKQAGGLVMNVELFGDSGAAGGANKDIVNIENYTLDLLFFNAFIHAAKRHGVLINQGWSIRFIDCSIEVNEVSGATLHAVNGNINDVVFNMTTFVNKCNAIRLIPVGAPDDNIIQTIGIYNNYLSSSYGEVHDDCIKGDARYVFMNDNTLRVGNSKDGMVLENIYGNPQKWRIHHNIFLGTSARYGINFGTSTNAKSVDMNHNEFDGFISPIYANLPNMGQDCLIGKNSGYNPLGVVATPINNYNHRITPFGTAAGPTAANQDYTVFWIPCRIISTGGTGVNITIKDANGTTISTPGATCDCWLEPGWKVNFGGFSAAPAIIVAFK